MKTKQTVKRIGAMALAVLVLGMMAGCGASSSSQPAYVYDSGVQVVKGETAGVPVIKYSDKTLLIYEDGSYAYKFSFSSDMNDVGNSLGGFTKVLFGKYTKDGDEKSDSEVTYHLEKPERIIQTNNIIATTEMNVDTADEATFPVDMEGIAAGEDAVDWILTDDNAIGATYLSNGSSDGHSYTGTVTVNMQTYEIVSTETVTY